MNDWQLHVWLNSSKKQREQMCEELVTKIPSKFRNKPLDSGKPTKTAVLLPEYIHEPTNTEWVYLPNGRYLMGFSEQEERAARKIKNPPPLNIHEMRPVHFEEVKPLLMMKYPVTWELACNYLEIDNIDERPEFEGPFNKRVAYLTRMEAEKLSHLLGFSLPYEREWEYACRGGTDTLFYFGNELPEDYEAISAFIGNNLANSCPNPFGLHSLFFGEWCYDHFKESYDILTETDDFVVRGGAAAFWPWQGSEWSFCLSAMRMPSQDLIEGLCGTRLVLRIK